MSIPATQRGRLPGRHTRPFFFDAARVIAVLKFLHDVFVEARTEAYEAKRRYPHFE